MKKKKHQWDLGALKANKREYQPDGVSDRGRQSWVPHRSVNQRWAPTRAPFVKREGEEE